MLSFTPSDWIEIGSSLIASWFGCRFAFLFGCALIGAEPAATRIEVAGSVVVHHDNGDD